MNNFSPLQLTALALVCVLAMPPAPLLASNRKGDKLWNEARTEEAKGNFDHALQLAEQAYELDPSDIGYQLEVRRVRFEAGDMHVKNGQKLRNAGKVSEALAEFEKAYAIDPASDIAMEEIKRTRAMIQRNSNPSGAPPAAANDSAAAKLKEDEKALTPSELAQKQSRDRTDALLPIPVLRPLNSEPIDLKMKNTPRVLFETAAKLAGINVLFDPEYDTAQTIRSQQIDVSRTTLDQALDQISIVTKSFWKPLSQNTIFVTVDNPTKRREYAEQVVKVFYLSNVTTPQEMQEMLTVLRTVVDVQKVFSFTSQNALIVRAESDTMALVEKLIGDLDKARSEVIIDVMVMEVNSTHMRNITAAFASTGLSTSAIFAPRPGITTPGIQSAASTVGNTPTTTTTGTTSTTTTPSTTTPGTGITPGTPNLTDVPLNALSHISSADFSITSLPGAALDAVLNDSSTKVLQAPQIRAVDNQKATLKIGEKVPTASGSFQPGVAGVGVSPLVNTQFTYLDVGVNMEVLPKVHENNEVSMHIDLDISQVDNYQNLGGISEPEIGQNKETADVRLRAGEINLIGGIIQKTDTKSTTGIPGLAGIPGLGWLFKGVNTENDRNELVIALIPHIVRGPDITESNLKGVAAGNATQIKVAYGPRVGAPEEKAAANPPTAPPAVAGLPAGAAPAAPGPPATAPPEGPPATAPPIGPPATAATIARPVPPGGVARISFDPPTVDTQLSSAVTVTIHGDDITDMNRAAAQLRYDPRILRINNIVAGDLPQRGIAEAARTEPSKNILNDSGQADVSVSRGEGSGGISGGGGLFTVVFQAIGRGTTNVSVSSISLTGSAAQPINAALPPPLVVNVK